MKHPLSALKRPLYGLLIVSLAAGHFARAEGDTTTSVLQGATGVLSTATQGVQAYSASATQMQMLANQLATLNQMQGVASPQLNALNQVKMNLAMAMTEAQMCVQNAKKDTTKYKKATIDGHSLENVAVTCTNYGNVIDSLKKNADQMNETNTKLACIRNLQNKINQIAETAKAPFDQLTQAANKIWSTRDQVIKIHKNIQEQITRDLDGQGGFRERLAKLEALALEMNDKITAMGEKQDQLKEARVATANQWYQSLMNQTQYCYDNNARKSCFGGAAMSAAACVRQYIGKTKKDSPVSRAQAGKNAEIFSATNDKAMGRMMEIGSQIQADVKDPNTFLNIVDQKFAKLLNETAQEYQSAQFVGKGVSNNELITFVRARYRECYLAAKQRFSEDMLSEGGPYKNSVNQLKVQERRLATEAKNLILSSKNAMTSFRTSFTKTYNRDLSMFTANCTANEDPNQNMDCLRKVQGMLNSGINGHPEEVVLADGRKVMMDSGTTNLSIPNLQVDAQGQPIPGQANTSCAGFNECINVLDRARESHQKAEQLETGNQEKFVASHNESVRSLMGGIAQSFSTMSEMITAAVTGLNQDLTKAGVTATVETKQEKGEELETDDKTGLIKKPTSMKKAFAGIGSYSEMGETGDVTSAINERKGILLKKMQEAAKAKQACLVLKGDYENIANQLSCSGKNICAEGIEDAIEPIETLMKRSQAMPATDNNGGRGESQITKDYKACIAKVESTRDRLEDRANEIDGDSDDDAIPDEFTEPAPTLNVEGVSEAVAEARKANYEAKLANWKREKAEWQAKKKNKKRTEARKETLKKQVERAEERGANKCVKAATASLASLANKSRGALQSQNRNLIAALNKFSAACKEDDEEAAQTACEQAKTSIGLIKPPTDGGETVLTSTGEDKKLQGVLKGGSDSAE